jgi:taurine--2-oxoglutarate transaminase
MSRSKESKETDEAKVRELTRKHVLIPWAVQGRHTSLVITRGEGCHFWDAAGKKYLDLSAQNACLNAGYNNKTIIDKIKSQLDTLPFVAGGQTTDVRAEYCKLFAEITPKNLVKTYIVAHGANAIEDAIKVTRAYTRRQKVMARYRSYHGATYGAMTVTSDVRRSTFEPGIPGILHVFLPYCYRCSFGHEYPKCNIECAEHVREVILHENPDTIAAMLVETITGSSGFIVPPPEYYPRLTNILKEFGILLICDEVRTGHGRTGTWFACEHWKIEPDILTCGKASAGGYVPFANFSISKELSDYFDEKWFYIGSTFSGHPVACAAGIGAIIAYKEGDLIGNSKRLGNSLLKRLGEMKEKHLCIGDVRGLGLFAGLELVKNKKTKEPIIPWFTNDFTQTDGIMSILKTKMLERGVLTFMRRNLIGIEPPLCITESELMGGLDILDEVLDIADRFIKN